MMSRTRRRAIGDPESGQRVIDCLREQSRLLEAPGDLDALLARVGDARFVLLGEASHGTSEFYKWRAEISKRLILEKGFRFLAVEGDWPSCEHLDRFIRGDKEAGSDVEETLAAFDRWPTWMWANQEIAELAEWLRSRNMTWPMERRVGFHGLDVYSLWDSLYAVTSYLRRADPGAIGAAHRAFRCFEPYGEDAQDYARATARLVPTTCEDEVVELLAQMHRRAPSYRADDAWDAFCAEQNALVVKNAEAYYRAMVRGGADSWNVRDKHMAATLERLANHYGPESRGIVWEHNTHIGDARYTDMAEDGSINVGQLVRERWGDPDVVLVGFTTHRGHVIAARAWDAPAERMEVPEARPGSWDDLLHQAGEGDQLLLLDALKDRPAFQRHLGQRAIGVVYHPEYERFGNYVPTILPRRYDALLHIDETDALHPLPSLPVPQEEVPETFPSGM
jgi:erythromycin esterase-like protein